MSEAAESMSIPKNITREHIIRTINEIDKNACLNISEYEAQ